MNRSGWLGDKAGSSHRAILVMCVGVLFLVLNDAIAKWLVTRYGPLQILFVRSLLALPLIAALICIFDDRKALISKRIRVHAVRGVIIVAATYAFILSLRSLPLAEATSLIFTAPIFVAVLSVPLLKESVGWRRGLVVAAGFLGALIIVRPGAATFQAASLLALAAAVLSALVMISARWVDGRDNFWTLLFYMTGFSAVFSAFAIFLPWPAPRPVDLVLFAGMAVLGPLGIALISQAVRMAPAAVVAPFNYTALVWASLLGWLVWGGVPDLWIYVGAAVIIASGLYLILAETEKKA